MLVEAEGVTHEVGDVDVAGEHHATQVCEDQQQMLVLRHLADSSVEYNQSHIPSGRGLFVFDCRCPCVAEVLWGICLSGRPSQGHESPDALTHRSTRLAQSHLLYAAYMHAAERSAYGTGAVAAPYRLSNGWAIL